MKKGIIALMAGVGIMASAQNINDGFVRITGGTFRMGSPAAERMRDRDEAQHSVTVSDFYVSPYEVTQIEYLEVTGKNPSLFSGNDNPVENVTWYDAVEYCNLLSQSRGLRPCYTVNGNTVRWDRSANGYRLLTEAEWEYACRAGTTTIYSFGDAVNSNLANFQGHYPYLIEENYVSRRNRDVVRNIGTYRGRPIKVGSFEPNAFGLYDMHGNVSEWVFDYYGEYSGAGGAQNPAGAPRGHLRVNRGGSYNDFGKHLRAAYRSATNPIDPDENLGFRVGRNAEAGSGTVVTTYDLNITIPNNPRILVAYYSYSGNTERAAQIIAENLGCALYEIEMENPYRGRGNIYETSQRDLMSETRVPLKGPLPNLNNYDVILLGYPTWWATMPMPVFTFLESYDLSGKSIFSFSSNGGTGFGDSVSDLSKEAKGAYVGYAYKFEYSGGGDLEGELMAWLRECGVTR